MTTDKLLYVMAKYWAFLMSTIYHAEATWVFGLGIACFGEKAFTRACKRAMR